MKKALKYAIPLLIMGLLVLKIPLTLGIDGKNYSQTVNPAITKYPNKIKIFDDDNSTDDNNGGDDGDDDGEDHEEDNGDDSDDNETDSDNEHVEIGENGSIISDDNRIDFEEDHPGLEYEYYLSIDNTTTVEIEINVQGNKIYEFIDKNNNSRVDSDEILQTFDMDNENWVITSNIVKDSNGSIIYVMYSYEYNDSAKHLIVNFYVYNKTYKIYDGGFDKIKVEILIDKWDWRSNESTIAYKFEAEISVEKEYITGEFNASTGYDDFGIYLNVSNKALVQFSWNTTVVVDGVAKNVTVAINKVEYEFENEEGESELELSIKATVIFPRFKNSLQYDPVIGVEDDPKDIEFILSTVTPPDSDSGTGDVGGGTDDSSGDASNEGSLDTGTVISLPYRFDGYTIILGILASIALLGVAILISRKK